MKFRSKISLLQLLVLAASLLWLGTAIAGGKPIKVTAANPNSATQGEALGVVISGSGFNDNDQVTFFVTETENSSEISIVPGSVISNANGTELTVSIEVNGEALDVYYDIEVWNSSSGRRGKGTTLFKVNKEGAGNEYPTFNVLFSDDMKDSFGWNWQSGSPGRGISYWRSDPKNGAGEISLDYFRISGGSGGPFAGDRGVKCFGAMGTLTPIEGVQLWEDSSSGEVILNLTFIGETFDKQIILAYHLQLKGSFDEPDNWLPLDWTTVTMTTWKLRINRKNLRKRYSNISCVDEGSFYTNIWVGRNP